MKARICIIALLLALLSGCASDYDWELKRLTDYGQDFVAEFGWPHARQNWNTAVRHKIKLDIPEDGDWTVKVFTADPLIEPKKSYLLGQFSVNASDDATLLVDGPYTLQNICVAIGNGNMVTKKSFAVSASDTIFATFDNENILPGIMPNAPKMSYIIAYEIADSTNTYLDFNDIILEVVHVSGESTAELKLRAVGAQENIKLLYQRSYNDEEVIIEDAIKAFGYNKPVFTINVESGAHDHYSPFIIKDFNVGEDFSIVQDAYRFIASVKRKKKVTKYGMLRNTEQFLGQPTTAFVVANPTWDWVSEYDAVEKRHRSFYFWARAYHKHNLWWDNIWDPGELMLSTDGVSYHPDYDYSDMIYSAKDIELNNGAVPDISFERLLPYTEGDIGANIAFVLEGRNEGRIKIMLERNDGGLFEWYPLDDDGVSRAYVDVYDKNVNVSAGVGNYFEACHILISTKTIKQIINEETSLHVVFDPKATSTKINSVWIRNR